jgi:hypothetical protein
MIARYKIAQNHRKQRPVTPTFALDARHKKMPSLAQGHLLIYPCLKLSSVTASAKGCLFSHTNNDSQLTPA